MRRLLFRKKKIKRDEALLILSIIQPLRSM